MLTSFALLTICHQFNHLLTGWIRISGDIMLPPQDFLGSCIDWQIRESGDAWETTNIHGHLAVLMKEEEGDSHEVLDLVILSTFGKYYCHEYLLEYLIYSPIFPIPSNVTIHDKTRILSDTSRITRLCQSNEETQFVRYTKIQDDEQVVLIAGPFTNWVPIEMIWSFHGYFEAEIPVVGRTYFKFNMGNRWKLSDEYPTEADDEGNINCYIDPIAKEEGDEEDIYFGEGFILIPPVDKHDSEY